MATTANGDVYEDELTASLLQPSMPDHDVDKPGMVGEPAEAPPHGLGALGAAGFIVSIILGLGVLGIPWAFAQLGWGFGISLLLVSAAGSVYSGFLIDKLAQYVTDHAQEPPRKYADLGEHAFGTRGRVAVRATQYAFLAGVIVAVQLTAAHSLHSVVTVLHGHICPVTANTVIAVIMLPVMQLQKLEEITPVAILGVVLILLPLLLYLTQLPKHTATSDTGVPESSSLADIAAATTTLCFAYQGQTIFPELRSEMADPTTFPRAVVSATVLMTTTYLIVGVVGYMRLGPDAAYLNYWDNEHNPTAGRTVAANIMLILHVMTGYTINGNVMNQAIAEALFGRTRSRLAWFGVTVCTLVASWALANAIPTLGLLIAFIGATCGVLLTFLIPISCGFKLLGKGWTRRDAIGHGIVCVLAVIVLIVGTYTTTKNLIKGMANHSKGSFNC